MNSIEQDRSIIEEDDNGNGLSHWEFINGSDLEDDDDDFERNRMRKLGKKLPTKKSAKRNPLDSVKRGCVYGKHGLGVKLMDITCLAVCIFVCAKIVDVYAHRFVCAKIVNGRIRFLTVVLAVGTCKVALQLGYLTCLAVCIPVFYINGLFVSKLLMVRIRFLTVVLAVGACKVALQLGYLTCFTVLYIGSLRS
ncbi:hypothetical protein ACFE04_022351 [Oxalis oulophora]